MIDVKRLGNGDEDLARKVVAAFWPEGQLNDEFFGKETNYLLAAYVDGTFAGFLYAYELERPETGRPMMFFYSIDVLESYRRRGVATHLIGELKCICAERNVSKMYVLTDEANAAAMNLYRSTGGERALPDNVLFVYKDY